MANITDPYNPLDRYNKYNESNSKIELEEEWWTYYKEMYIQDFRGKNGPFDTNEEQIWKKNGMTFMPGKVYTYGYDPKYADILAFYDRRPIMFCIAPTYISPGTKNTLVRGLNLTFLPPKIRISLLGDFWEFFNSQIDEDLQAVYKGKRNAGWEKIPLMFKRWEERIKRNRFYKTAFEFAERKYIVHGPDDGRITKLRLVEYQHWHILGYLNSKKFFTGETPQGVWKQYSQAKNKK